ncbi:MAG: hypothetical protein HY912_19555 [Desulfomonile tiedjei]|uniref:Uncharacterized protein n=1 Tax=Desulfomonile tiedjei TaxID=2358 RepID=A0A9D6V6V7_9BACT|nr:hypothetical protein [Desulfomonile tiedjei]
MRTNSESNREAILSLEEIRAFHPAFRPHFLDSLDQNLQFGSINVFVNETCKLVVAAPHGFKKDDRNTENLAHALACELKANAVINDNKYRKPKRPDDPEAQALSVSDPVTPSSDDLAMRQEFLRKTSAIPVDLNKWPDAKIAAPDFYHPLAAISRTLCRNSTPLVIFIHGMADQSLGGERNPDFVVAAGYEYLRKEAAFRMGLTTAGKLVVDRMVSGLRGLENNGRQVWVEEGLPGYAAARPIRMPWLFKMLAGMTGEALSVHAIQLEIRHKGFREIENIPATARKLGAIFRNL